MSLKHTPLTPNKTYASEANVHKAVAAKFPAYASPLSGVQLNYFVMPYRAEGATDWRYFPVFVGERALQAMVHFHFNVVA